MRHRRRWQLAVLAIAAIVVVTWVGFGSGSKTNPSPSATAPDSLPALDQGQVTRGRQVFLANCAACHGANAQGAPNWRQPDAQGNLPPPPHDDSGHTWRHGDADLTEIILNGLRDPFNKSQDLTMPPFKGRLSDEEIADVIAYFKSLWSPEHRRYQEEQTQRPPMTMATPETGR